MLQAILPLSKYIKLKSVRIYDFAFSLHSKVSVTILIICTLLVSARQYFGQPIECMSSDKQTEFINLFCWTMGTYVLTDPQGRTKRDSIAEGVGVEYTGTERVYLRYYQWVVIILLLQALMFIFPAFLWKSWEGGLMTEVCTGLERNNVMISNKDYKEHRSRLLNLFTTDFGPIHRGYAKKYFLCEIMNFLICVLNLTLMNIFFNNFWTSYSNAMSTIPAYNWDQWNEMSSKVFPKLAKCEFFKYGASGSTSRYDALCVLPLNILNEKIFAFLYIWFLFLMVASAAHITFRVIVACSLTARVICLSHCSVGHNQRTKLRQLLYDMSYSEWFILMRIASNVNPVMFDDLLRDLLDLQKFKNIEISV